MKSPTVLAEHLQSFEKVWSGGYFEGDPLDPLGPSKYRRIGYLSQIHAVYQVCVRPYVDKETVVLEIGPGRGAWTRTMLQAKEIWCLDAKSREENSIDEYLNHPTNLFYHQVRDFSCAMLPDNKFTFLFSFGCFCHVPFEGITEYAKNLFPKLKSGANGFWMVADYDKRNSVSRHFARHDIFARTLPRRVLPFFELFNKLNASKLFGPASETQLDKSRDGEEGPAGRWYHGGSQRTSKMLEDCGYEVLSNDVGLVPRDAIVHFRKP